MSVLTRVMARPESLGELSPRSWDDLLILARDARVLARLHGYVEDRQLQGSIPVAAAEVLQSARIGADVATMPPAVIKGLFKHVLTDKGLEGFIKDWEKTGQSIPTS